MPMKPVPVNIRVWRRISKRGEDECWPWTGATNDHKNRLGGPYGIIGSGGKYGSPLYVHRVVHESEIGPIPEGYEVDHSCRNPLCCNPGHLEAVPPGTNNNRSSSPTSLNAAKTHCPQGHEYTSENTGNRRGKSWRYCRTCAREAQRAKRHESKTYAEWRATADHLNVPEAG